MIFLDPAKKPVYTIPPYVEGELMDSTIGFRLNDEPVNTMLGPGTPVLDFLRKDAGLDGTKEGCREGDCGACAVLVGEADRGGSGVSYRAVPSCLLALGELEGCHLVTIEGLVSGRRDGLTPVMKAFLEENASQCGFCSPGFVISLSAWLANPAAPLDLAAAMTAVDGNLCRCTGYGSIKRAAARLAREFSGLPSKGAARLEALVRLGVLPASVEAFMADVACRPASSGHEARSLAPDQEGPSAMIGGGTDWYVRNPDPDAGFRPTLLRDLPGFSGIAVGVKKGKRRLELGGALRVSEFFASQAVRTNLPGILPFERAFASTLVRNLATLGGNIANASPVGDLTCMLMALGASLELATLSAGAPPPGEASDTTSGEASGVSSVAPDIGLNAPAETREVALDAFFLGYKKTGLREGEAIRRIFIPLVDSGAPPALFSFEKAAKRGKLDIAAVNTALSFRVTDGTMKDVRLSAGGVAPVPLLLKKSSLLLEGTKVDTGAGALAALARAVAATAEGEISPIGDVRGSAEYRRRMTGRFVLAHFIRLFPDSGLAEELFP